jgi:branched-subunit amino acid transport protein
MNAWATIALAGAGTFAIRLSWLALARPGGVPPAVREALRFVMPAVLAAIVAPAVLYAGSRSDLALNPANNERILAALAAAAIAWTTRNTWLTIAGGMTALWALKAVG